MSNRDNARAMHQPRGLRRPAGPIICKGVLQGMIELALNIVTLLTALRRLESS